MKFQMRDTVTQLSIDVYGQIIIFSKWVIFSKGSPVTFESIDQSFNLIDPIKYVWKNDISFLFSYLPNANFKPN